MKQMAEMQAPEVLRRDRRVEALVVGHILPFDRSMADVNTSSGTLDPAAQQALLQAVAVERDRQAFATLFRHFAPRIKAYLVRLGAEDGVAEELAQEAMVAVWRKAESFDPTQARVSTWIFTIARNKRIDALRREKRPELDPTDPVLVPERDETAERHVELAQRQVLVQAALKSLPAEQAEVVRLAYFEDMAHGAIAERTDLPLGTVKSRLRLAMGRLRKVLDAEGLE